MPFRSTSTFLNSLHPFHFGSNLPSSGPFFPGLFQTVECWEDNAVQILKAQALEPDIWDQTPTALLLCCVVLSM